jgi:hypothetical protein
MTLKGPTHVSESNEPEVEQSAQQEPSQARIHVPEALTSHRERDEDYPAVVSLSDTVRVIDCKDGIQWILQRRYGDQWRGVAFCRRRDPLIREAKKLVAHVSEALLSLPEHHDGLSDDAPRRCLRPLSGAGQVVVCHVTCFASRIVAHDRTHHRNSPRLRATAQTLPQGRIVEHCLLNPRSRIVCDREVQKTLAHTPSCS